LERNAVSENDRVRELVDALTKCLAELDSIDAPVAAAHLDAALQALRRQFGLSPNTSDTE
jgi:hypothetical protein